MELSSNGLRKPLPSRKWWSQARLRTAEYSLSSSASRRWVWPSGSHSGKQLAVNFPPDVKTFWASSEKCSRRMVTRFWFCIRAFQDWKAPSNPEFPWVYIESTRGSILHLVLLGLEYRKWKPREAISWRKLFHSKLFLYVGILRDFFFFLAPLLTMRTWTSCLIS